MKNIVNYDFNDSNKNGLYSVDVGDNALLLYLTPLATQKTNYVVEIINVSGTAIKSNVLSKNENGQIEYSIDSSYFNGTATMTIRLLSSEVNSKYITFNCISFTGEDLLLKKVNDYEYAFSIKLPASSYLYPPIGAQIYNSRKDFDPNEYYPGTKWARIKGYVLAGINEDDSTSTQYLSFNKKSGEKLGATYQNLRAWVGATDSNTSAIGYRAAPRVSGIDNYTYAVIGTQAWNNRTNINHTTLVSNTLGQLDISVIQPTQMTYIWERIA